MQDNTLKKDKLTLQRYETYGQNDQIKQKKQGVLSCAIMGLGGGEDATKTRL